MRKGRPPSTSDTTEEKFEEVAARVLPKEAGGGARRKGLTKTELVAAVCKAFTDGCTPAETCRRMESDFGIILRREEPGILWRYAARKGWFVFKPTEEVRLEIQLRTLYGWLENVAVVHTAVVDHVANRGAKLLVELIVKHAAQGVGKKEVHVGLSGGVAVWKVAKALAREIQSPIPGLPETIVLHALVAGFDSEQPTTDPNAYISFFTNPEPLYVKVLPVNLRGPDIIVDRRNYEAFKTARGIKKAFGAAKDLDIILTSASDWGDPHNMLRNYMAQCPETTAMLAAETPAGDILWRPFNEKGPIEIETEIRAMTLLELRHLPRFIERGKDVVLVLGPCGGCNEPKGRLLKALLELDVSLFNHLVVDTRTVRQMMPADEKEARQSDAAQDGTGARSDLLAPADSRC